MIFYGQDDREINLQEHEDTNWENLNSDGTIIGRIVNGVAAIRIANFRYNVQKAGELVNIFKLPDRYSTDRQVYFFLAEGTSDKMSFALIGNSDDVSIAVSFRAIGQYTFLGYVCYPIKKRI